MCNCCGFAAMKAKHFISTWRSFSSFLLAAGVLSSREALPVLTPGTWRRALAVSILVKHGVQNHIRHLQAQIPLIVEETECSKTLGTIKHFTLVFMSKISFKGKLLVRDAMGKELICSSCWREATNQWLLITTSTELMSFLCGFLVLFVEVIFVSLPSCPLEVTAARWGEERRSVQNVLAEAKA